MAWGIFNKIKKGLKTFGDKVVKGAQFINNNILKPGLPIAGKMIDNFVPGASNVLNNVSKVIDKVGDYRNNLNNNRAIQYNPNNEIIPRFKDDY